MAYPDIAIHGDRDPHPIRRHARMEIGPWRGRKLLLPPLPIDPYQRAWRGACADTDDVCEGPVAGYIEIGGSRHRTKLRDYCHGCSTCFQTSAVERHRTQRSSCHVNQVSARHVACGTATPYQHFRVTGCEVESGHLRGADPTRRRGYGKEHGPAIWQHLGPEMIRLAACLLGSRHHSHLAAIRGYGLEAGGRIRIGKDDPVIRCPGRRGPNRITGIYNSHYRAAGQGHLLDRCAFYEPDPLIVG